MSEQLNEMLDENKGNYEWRYAAGKECHNYPAGWIIRFHNTYMRQNLPTGKVLDYGYGSGSNSIFFMHKGYEVHGVEVTPSSEKLLADVLKMWGLNSSLAKNFHTISPDATKLDYPDESFDMILSNQVLYYLSSKDQIKKVCREMKRCLKPGGIVFFTMMSPQHYYISQNSKPVDGGPIHEVKIDDPKARLNGLHEFIYVVKNENELKELFSDFECIDIGFFDFAVMDIKQAHHWIFVGRKK